MKGPLQQTKMLSSQFCLLNQLWFDVFGDLSLQTCYTCISVVYLKCFKAFFVFTGPQWESGWDLFVLFYLFYFIFFFCVGKSLACHSPGKWYLCA